MADITPERPMLTIRPERDADRHAVFAVNEAAFERPDEARLVDALRRSPAFVRELSLVAFDEGQLVGHILFSRIGVGQGADRHEALALAPMAVLPAVQRRGVGSALVRRGLADATRLGFAAVIVLGHPGYYPRFGFEPAAPHDIRAPFEVPGDAFMVLELQPGAFQRLRGEVEYPPEFAAV